jgi:hypothetical protein
MSPSRSVSRGAAEYHHWHVTDEEWQAYERRLADYERQLRAYERQRDLLVRYGRRSPYGPLGRLGSRPSPPDPPASRSPGRFVKPLGAGRRVRNQEELRASFCAWRDSDPKRRRQSDFAEWLGLTDDRQVRRYCQDYGLPWRELLRTRCH